MGSPQHDVGRTRDTGYQIGVRRTFPISLEDAWRHLTSPDGVQRWLGLDDSFEWLEGSAYELGDGTTGELRVFKPLSHIRITWHPPGWPRASTIQIRIIPKGEKSVIAFHQEHLPGPEAREQRRMFFTGVLDDLARTLA